MDPRTVDLAQRARVPAIFLSWRQPEDVKAVIRLLGQLYSTPDVAETYNRYFDEVLATIDSRIARAGGHRPRVLYTSLRSMTQPHLIAEWWIARAGGNSVTDDGRSSEALHFTIEQLLAWDPEIMIVSSPDEIADAYADKRLSGVSAVRNRRVYAVPMGVHLWGNRTVEQPLTIMWAAKLFHPDAFDDLDVPHEVAAFYRRFFKSELTATQIEEVLSGRSARR
jgi:iron complex transport system substrate-binding protein